MGTWRSEIKVQKLVGVEGVGEVSVHTVVECG